MIVNHLKNLGNRFPPLARIMINAADDYNIREDSVNWGANQHGGKLDSSWSPPSVQAGWVVRGAAVLRVWRSAPLPWPRSIPKASISFFLSLSYAQRLYLPSRILGVGHGTQLMPDGDCARCNCVVLWVSYDVWFIVRRWGSRQMKVGLQLFQSR